MSGVWPFCLRGKVEASFAAGQESDPRSPHPPSDSVACWVLTQVKEEGDRGALCICCESLKFLLFFAFAENAELAFIRKQSLERPLPPASESFFCVFLSPKFTLHAFLKWLLSVQTTMVWFRFSS